MRIKCLEVFSIEGVRYEKDDVRTVPDDVGQTACQEGWAEDLEEDVNKRVPTGERSIYPKQLKVAKVRADVGATKAGG